MPTQARVEGLNPDLRDENGYAVVAPDITKRVRRGYPEVIDDEPRWPCSRPASAAAEQWNGALAGEAMAAFRRPPAQIRSCHERRRS
jgi:hypothetical protein